MDKGKRPMICISSDNAKGKEKNQTSYIRWTNTGTTRPNVVKEYAEQRRKERESEAQWDLFNHQFRKFHNRKNRKDKDWVPSKQEIEDEHTMHPGVRHYFNKKNGELASRFHILSKEGLPEFEVLKRDCWAKHHELDKCDEEEFWTIWDAKNETQVPETPMKKLPVRNNKIENEGEDLEDDDYVVDITQD